MSKKFILLFCLLLATFPVAQAQSSGALSVQIAGEADSTAFPAVTFRVAVRDANGVPVPDLQANHFEILEESIDQPRPIQTLAAQVNPDTPISIVLIMDISQSMQGQPLADAKAAATNLLAQLGPQDEVALIAFADAIDFDSLDPNRESGFTTDKAALTNLINGLEAGGGTPLYDALLKGARLATEANLGHRAILLLTDGVDETPGSIVATSDTPIGEANRANLPIFTIGLGTRFDPGYLERLALTTGGTYQHTPDSATLGALFQNALERLKQEYVISYQSGYDCDGQTHRVELNVNVSGRSAETSFSIGPLVDNPGCNPQAVATVTGPTMPDPTATATPPPTITPSPNAVPVMPTVTATVSPPLTNEETSDSPSPLLWGIPVAFVGLIGVLVAGSVLYFLVKQRAKSSGPTCIRCGYRLHPGETSCPQCGSTQTSPGLRH